VLTQLEQLEQKYPDLDALVASMNGKSAKQWEREHGMSSNVYYQLKKKYETGQEGEPSAESVTLTVLQALNIQRDLKDEIKSVDLILGKGFKLAPGVIKVLQQHKESCLEQGSRIREQLERMTINLG